MLPAPQSQGLLSDLGHHLRNSKTQGRARVGSCFSVLVSALREQVQCGVTDKSESSSGKVKTASHFLSHFWAQEHSEYTEVILPAAEGLVIVSKICI